MAAISIIVPVYNVEPYLHRCVDSILAQTFSDFELILVDDGSPDGCPAICDEYAQKDPRIRVIHQKNSGVSKARNTGIDVAQGTYIMFCDSDDYVEPDWCASMMRCVAEDHQNYIFCDHVCEQDEQIKHQDTFKSYPQYELGIARFLELQVESKVGFVWNVLFYADIINRLQLRFWSESANEDLSFCIHYLELMSRISFTGSLTYHYVQSKNDSLSHRYYQDEYSKWQQKYAMMQWFIDNKIPGPEQEQSRRILANSYLYFFLNSLNNTFDSRSKLSWWQKMCYNQNVVRSAEFQHCLQYSDGTGENLRYLNLLQKGDYCKAYIYTCLAKVKMFLSGGVNHERNESC